jgi:diguanylate cyclase (GGDEF)-like protein/PAS domain S-box-containing protein
MTEVLAEDETRNTLSPLAGVDDRFRVIFDSVNDGIFISNAATGRFIEVNQPGSRMFGYNKAELIGRDIELLSSGIHPYTQDMAIEQCGKASSGGPQTFEWQCKTKDGVLFWSEISIRFLELGHTPAVVAIVRDITERKRQDAQISYMAHHDALTGLANRSMFATALDRAIAQSLRTGKKFAVLFLDLDRFKDVNDTRGHPIGDRLLRLVAARLQAGVRANADVARLGGDEFAILQDDLQEPDEIAALATRLIVSIGRPFSIDGNALHVGASIGVAIYGKDACDAETLMSHADIALYRAKAEGRQTYRFHSDSMNEEVRARVTLTDELRLAVPGGQLFIAYQPMVSAKGGRIVGVEALVRWRHPRLGILLPHRFLPVAVSSGLIVSIDRWVLGEACRQGRQWIDAGIAAGTICVNLSTAQFKEPLELEKCVLAVLAETRLPPHLLELEITESTLIGLSPQHGKMIERLRSAGVRFSLDDFGTGYSSLNYLRRFSVDRIKIAQEFISDLATSAETANIVKLILNLARNFGNDAIAEGVETLEQLRLLQDWDCPNIQGFCFAPPMSAEAIVPLLSAGTINPSGPCAAFAA